MSHEAESRRLTVLKALAASAAFRANEGVIARALDRFGFSVARHVVRGDLAWLEAADLVRVQRVDDDYMIATLTEHGDDVQAGRTHHPGVARPSAPRA